MGNKNARELLEALFTSMRDLVMGKKVDLMDEASKLFGGELRLKEPPQKRKKVLVTFVFDQLSHCLGNSNLLSCVSFRILEKLII